jgi:hypothetical protein
MGGEISEEQAREVDHELDDDLSGIESSEQPEPPKRANTGGWRTDDHLCLLCPDGRKLWFPGDFADILPKIAAALNLWDATDAGKLRSAAVLLRSHWPSDAANHCEELADIREGK